MNSPEADIAELRARLAQLEGRIAALEGSKTPPAPAPVPASEPPLIPSVRPKSVAVRREISSTVWVAAAGAVIFLLGAIYGLTVSIQRGWISPAGRVVTGLGVGVVAGIMAARLLQGGRRALGVTLLAVGAGTWTFALYFAAHGAALLPLGAGFGGATLAVLAAGYLAKKSGSDGALAVGLGTGLVAPMAFSSGQGTLAGLSGYLAMLGAAQLAVHYFSATGAQWRWSRSLGLGAVWLVVWSGAVSVRRGEPEAALLGLALLGGVLLILCWLPRHREEPWLPGAGSLAVLGGAGVAAWNVWWRTRWAHEGFSVVLTVLAAVALALVFFARRRTGGRTYDQTLTLVALAFAMLALLTALEWRWVGLTWSLLAVVLAVMARRGAPGGTVDAAVLSAAGLVAAGFSTIHWVALCFWQEKSDVLFLNPIFSAGLLTSVAWAALIAGTNAQKAMGFVAGQAVLVNAVAWEFTRAVPDFRGEEATLAFGALLATLTYAVAGAGVWLRGVIYEADAERASACRRAGYAWLGVAAVKLLVYDLEQADLAFRAVAALAVGGLFIAAAYWADRQRPQA